MQILVNRGQSEWLARQQGSLFKVNEQDTLYSMCTFECPTSWNVDSPIRRGVFVNGSGVQKNRVGETTAYEIVW